MADHAADEPRAAGACAHLKDDDAELIDPVEPAVDLSTVAGTGDQAALFG